MYYPVPVILPALYTKTITILLQLKSNDIAYVLRSWLNKEPANLIKSIEDDIIEMLKGLDKKYGDPAKIADTITDGIWRFRTIKEGEDKRFIEFVSIVEDGHRDLVRLGLETEITTISFISIIEKALLTDIRRNWAETVSCPNSIVEKSNKFPSLVEYLQNKTSAIEYDNDNLRASSGSQF